MVLPRMRLFAAALQTDELQGRGSITCQKTTPETLVCKKLRWEADRSIGSALDLVVSAVSLGNKRIAIDAAKFLYDSRHCRSRFAREIFDFVLDETETESINAKFAILPPNIAVQDGNPSMSFAVTLIREIRSRIYSQIDDPIGWAILAHAHTLVSNKSQALRCIDIARHLAPNDRYILRLASRLYYHFEEAEIAHQIIFNASRVTQDPWLLATEISLDHLCSRRSKFTTHAGKLLKHAQPATKFSELAAVLGTLESEHGNAKKSRDLFRFALKIPTENSLAQAIYLFKSTTAWSPDALQQKHHEAFEAIALSAFFAGNWKQVIQHTNLWQEDEMCSIRPAEVGSFVAITFLQDLQMAIKLTELGLRANPNAFSLKNNLAVAYAYIGKISSSEEIIKNIREESLDNSQKVTLEATRGLLAFRQDDFITGRKRYTCAADMARKLEDETLAYVKYFHAIEEIRATHDPEWAKRVRQDAETAFRKIPSPPVIKSLKENLSNATKDKMQPSKLSRTEVPST